MLGVPSTREAVREGTGEYDTSEEMESVGEGGNDIKEGVGASVRAAAAEREGEGWEADGLSVGELDCDDRACVGELLRVGVVESEKDRGCVALAIEVAGGVTVPQMVDKGEAEADLTSENVPIEERRALAL